jgi:hypothetical protein
VEEVRIVGGKGGGGEESKEKKGKEKRKKKRKLEGEKGKWNKSGLSILKFGQNKKRR